MYSTPRLRECAEWLIWAKAQLIVFNSLTEALGFVEAAAYCAVTPTLPRLRVHRARACSDVHALLGIPILVAIVGGISFQKSSVEQAFDRHGKACERIVL
nr:hypothetical protein CFP56_04612 [Quercus suber]